MSKTYLSENVKFLLVDIGNEYKASKMFKYIKNNYINEQDLLFNWDLIENDIPILKDLNINDSSLTQNTINNIIKECWPIYYQASYYLNKSTRKQQEYLWTLCEWTNNSMNIKYFFNIYKEKHSSEAVIEIVLYLCATLERALGNIYRIKERNVPFLLRDLLNSDELKSLLLPSSITFLQILIGHSKFLNIRNICWHGFISIDEFAPEFIAILFLCISDIGKQLVDQSISINTIPYRKQFENFGIIIKSFVEYFENLPDKIDIYFLNMSPTKFIPKSTVTILKRVYSHYKNEKYGQCILLLIPQIEHILRIFFCYVNKCETRLLTAESTTFYITLDEILNENLQDGSPNRLISTLGDNRITILLDIFSYINGPRIRDKISHGEIDLDVIHKLFTFSLLYVTIDMIDIVDSDYFQIVDKNENENNKTPLSNYKYLIKEKCSSYISCYHLSSMIKEKIYILIDNLQSWKSFERELKDKQENLIQFKSKINRKQSFDDIINELENNFRNFLKINNDYFKDLIMNMNYEKAKYEIYTIAIITNFMCKKEIELLSILNRLSENTREIIDNILMNINAKNDQFKTYQMRSRQRENFIKFFNNLPYLYQIISLILNIIFQELKMINQFKYEINVCLIYRSLKWILQYMENIKTFTNINTNKWGEIINLTIKINKLFNNFKEKREN